MGAGGTALATAGAAGAAPVAPAAGGSAAGLPAQPARQVATARSRAGALCGRGVWGVVTWVASSEPGSRGDWPRRGRCIMRLGRSGDLTLLAPNSGGAGSGGEREPGTGRGPPAPNADTAGEFR